MARKNSSAKGSFTGLVLKIAVVMALGLAALEGVLAFGFNSSVIGSFGGDNGPPAKVVDTPMKQNMRVVANTSLHTLPSLKSKKVATLKPGTSLRVIAKTTVDDDVWYQTVRFGGKIGYVHGSKVRRE